MEVDQALGAPDILFRFRITSFAIHPSSPHFLLHIISSSPHLYSSFTIPVTKFTEEGKQSIISAPGNKCYPLPDGSYVTFAVDHHSTTYSSLSPSSTLLIHSALSSASWRTNQPTPSYPQLSSPKTQAGVPRKREFQGSSTKPGKMTISPKNGPGVKASRRT